MCGLLYLGKPHAVPLVGRLLRLGRVHQLEARLVLLVKVGVLTTSSELRGILIWRQNKIQNFIRNYNLKLFNNY